MMSTRDRPAGDRQGTLASRTCMHGRSGTVKNWGGGTIQPPTAAPAPRQVDEVKTDVEASYGWLLGVWVLVGAFALLTLIASYRIGIPVRDPHGEVLRL